MLPGDPARTLGRGRFSTGQQLEAFRHTYGLDQSLPQQFLTFLQNTFTGHLGVSLRYRVPVSHLIRSGSADGAPGRHVDVLAMLIGVWIGMTAPGTGRAFDRISTASP